VLSIWSELLPAVIANRGVPFPTGFDRIVNNRLFLIGCCAVSDPGKNFYSQGLFPIPSFLDFYLRLDRVSVIANIPRVPTFD
jgi:hypothetical protein